MYSYAELNKIPKCLLVRVQWNNITNSWLTFIVMDFFHYLDIVDKIYELYS